MNKYWWIIIVLVAAAILFFLFRQRELKPPVTVATEQMKQAQNDDIASAIQEFKAVLDEHPLTEHDVTMLNQIFSQRIQGIMVKIDPQYSEHGSAVHLWLTSKTEELGGIDSEKGKAFMNQALKVLEAYTPQ